MCQTAYVRAVARLYFVKHRIKRKKIFFMLFCYDHQENLAQKDRREKRERKINRKIKRERERERERELERERGRGES